MESGSNSTFVIPVKSGLQSPVVSENGIVTFNFKMPADNASDEVYLMGTLTDWGNGQKMNYDEEQDIYTLTLQLNPGTYQYKFKTLPNTWYADPLNTEPLQDTNSVVKIPGLTLEADSIAGVGPVEVKANVPSDSDIDLNSLQWSIETVSDNDITGIDFEIDPSDPTKGTVTATKDAKNVFFNVVLTYEENGEEKFNAIQLYHSRKAYLYEYEYKEDSEHKGETDIYVWYNSQAGGVGYSLKEVNGKNIAYITVDDSTESFGYIARLYGEWGDDDREFTDRTLYVNTDDLYTKVRGGEGVETPYLLPSGKTTYDNGIKFVYRDDDLFYQNKMDTLEESEVKVLYRLKGSETAFTEADMTYNPKDELFAYSVSANDLSEGTYEFKFSVAGTEIEDQYYDGEIEFYRPALDISATVSNQEVDYDMNPLVSLDIKEESTGETLDSDKISSITADLTNLGYTGMNVPFSTKKTEGVLYIDRSVKPGIYAVPITVTDKWGNKTESSVDIHVVERTASTPSWDESTVYFLLTDRFADGDESNNTDVDKSKIEAYHGGDFKGLISKLDYIQDLGVNTIWITPIVDNIEDIMNEELHQQAYHGYWAKDFTAIDEHLGTIEDFDQLIDEAANRGIRVMVDIVVNHAGYNTNDSENFSGMLRENAVTSDDDVIHGELSNLPDFITENPEVRERLVAWQTAWANHETANGNRVSYFRVDTVKHVEHDTWVELKTSIAKENPTFKMIGEFFGGSITNTGDYLGNGQMDALLDFDFKSQAGSFIAGNLDSVEEAMESRNAKLSSSLTTGQFLGSHDEDGFLATTAGGDTAKMKVAAALQLTAKGIPVIYYGEEINLSGPEGYGKQDNNRYDMQFDNLSEEQQAMLAHYKKLLAARNAYSNVFASGDRSKVAGSDTDGYIVFKRSTDSENVYVGLNNTGEAKQVTFNVSETGILYNAYSGEDVAVNNGKVTVTLPANADGGTFILATKSEESEEAINPVKPVQPTTVVATGITLDQSEASIAVGRSINLKATVTPANATDKTVTFKSSNEKVATVTADGKVTAVAKGSATITATTANGKSATCKITVTVPATKVYVNQSLTIKKGQSKTLTATIVPADSTDKLTWKSSAPKKVSVDKNGKIKAVATGSAKITVTTDSGKKATCKVTVVKSAKKATKVTIDKTAKTMKIGEVRQLKVTVKPAKTTDQVTFSSSKKSVIAVAKNGVMTAKKPGKATITVKAGKKKAKIQLTVSQPSTAVTLNKTSATIKKGKTLKLKATLTPKNSTDTLKFTSSKKSVATVNSKGVVTAKKAGTATITVKTSSGKKATCKVTVQ